MGTCNWIHGNNEESNTWETGCGELFEFETAGPNGNGFNFCPYCGNTLVELHDYGDDHEPDTWEPIEERTNE